MDQLKGHPWTNHKQIMQTCNVLRNALKTENIVVLW